MRLDVAIQRRQLVGSSFEVLDENSKTLAVFLMRERALQPTWFVCSF